MIAQRRPFPPGKRIWLVLLLLPLSYPLAAQEPFDLEACIQYAMVSNNSIKSATFDEYIAQAQIKEFAATGFPQISLAADLQYFIELPTQILPGFFAPEQDIVLIDGKPYPLTRLDPETFQPIPGNEVTAQFGFPWQSTAGVNLNWRALDPAYFYGLKAARELSSLREIESRKTREEVAYNVANAYIQALISRQQQSLLEVNLSRVSRLLEETKALNQEGFVEAIDVDRLQITLNNLNLEQANIKRYIRLSDALLKFQMGMPLADELALSEPEFDLAELPELPITDEIEFNPMNDLNYSILRQAEELQTLNFKRTRSGYLPSLTVFGSYQYNAQRSEFNLFEANQDWFPISVVGLQLNWNIFDSFIKVRQMEQQRLGIDQVKLQQETVLEAASLEYEQANIQLLNAYNTLSSTKANVGLASNIYKVTTIKYKEGVGSSLEVNQAGTELQEAENAYLAALYSYLQSEIAYDKAMGNFSTYHFNR